MLDKTEYSRLLIKRSDTPGVVPTIPPFSADSLNQFIPSDIMIGEFFANVADDLLWIRTENNIYPIPLSGGQITGVTGNFEIISGQTWTELYSGSGATSIILDWDDGNVQEWRLTGSTEIRFANPKPGATYVAIIKQGAAGGYTITWDGDAVKWGGGITPTMTSTANRYDVYTFVYNGIVHFGSYVQNFTV